MNIDIKEEKVYMYLLDQIILASTVKEKEMLASALSTFLYTVRERTNRSDLRPNGLLLIDAFESTQEDCDDDCDTCEEITSSGPVST